MLPSSQSINKDLARILLLHFIMDILLVADSLPPEEKKKEFQEVKEMALKMQTLISIKNR